RRKTPLPASTSLKPPTPTPETQRKIPGAPPPHVPEPAAPPAPHRPQSPEPEAPRTTPPPPLIGKPSFPRIPCLIPCPAQPDSALAAPQSALVSPAAPGANPAKRTAPEHSSKGTYPQSPPAAPVPPANLPPARRQQSTLPSSAAGPQSCSTRSA